MNRSVRAGLACLALATLLTSAGCPPERLFSCLIDDDCAGAATAGRCEATGQCSFADATCSSGWRYGDHAMATLERECVAVNLLANATFESGLAGWTGYNSTLTVSDLARTGNQAVQVCANAGQEFFTLSDQPASAQDATAGAMYSASIWVRASPGSSAILARLSIDERADGGVDSSSPQVPLGDAWQLLQISHVVQIAGNVGLVVRATGMEPGACFLADDATFSP